MYSALIAAIPAILQGVSSLLGGAAASDQNEKQREWNVYNAQMAYSTNISNIETSNMIAEVNASEVLFGSLISTHLSDAVDIHNASLIKETALYNGALYEKDLQDVWNQYGLDDTLLQKQRARERGTIVAAQSASGTTVGEGSNKDVVIDQMAQEAMDRFVLKTGATVQADKIMNARMQSLFSAEQEIKKISFEGSMRDIGNNASSMMRASSILTESAMNSIAGYESATSSLLAGMSGANMSYSANATSINNSVNSGVLGAIGQGVSSYLKYKSN